MPELVRLNKGLNKSKFLTQRSHLHMKDTMQSSKAVLGCAMH